MFALSCEGVSNSSLAFGNVAKSNGSLCLCWPVSGTTFPQETIKVSSLGQPESKCCDLSQKVSPTLELTISAAAWKILIALDFEFASNRVWTTSEVSELEGGICLRCVSDSNESF